MTATVRSFFIAIKLATGPSLFHDISSNRTSSNRGRYEMWPDEVDEILDSDQVVALAYCTPANGAVLTPLTNFGLRDRSNGTLTAVNSSVGVYRKLERIRANPRIALVYHTRTHGFSERSEYVLVQGTATLRPAVPDYPKSIQPTWERFGGAVDIGPLWDWWLRVYNLRFPIETAVERVIVWPELACEGAPVIYGAPVTTAPEPQREPKKGTGPRIDHRRAARRASKLENVLLGWVGADGFPVAIPARPGQAGADGIELRVPRGLVPSGGRRAGLLAHEFARYTAGQNLRKHTGWLEADPGATTVTYAPHTEAGYHMPWSMTVYRLAAGAGTRRGLRGARRAGFVPQVASPTWTPSSNSGS